MNRQAPSGLSFVMVSNTWTRLSLEEMVVGSTALVLAFSVGVTFVSIVLFTRDFRLAIFTTLTTVLCISTLLRYHDFCAEVGVRSFGGHLLDDVRGLERGLHCACGTCLQPILSGDPAAKGGGSTHARGQCCVGRCHDHLGRFVVPLAVLDLLFRPVGHASLLANSIICGPMSECTKKTVLKSSLLYLVCGPMLRVHQENGSEARPHKQAVRRMLTLLGHKDANRCTLKAFRAGRATSLAAAGSPIGVILAAGEWKSSAFLRYCQADEISVSAVLEVVCAEDED